MTPGYFELTYDGEPNLELTELDGIGPKTAERLAERDIDDQGDLLLFLPRDYRRVGRHLSGAQLKRHRPDAAVLVARVERVEPSPAHSRAPLQVHVDADGQPISLLWFNDPYPGFADRFDPGDWVSVEGEIEWDRHGASMPHPTVEILSGRPRSADGARGELELEPVYTSMEGIAGHRIRSGIEQAADRLLPRARDVVPARLRERHDLPEVAAALRTLHLLDEPGDDWGAELERARARLVYEEFFTLQRALTQKYLDERRVASAPVCEQREPARELVRRLPFTLTDDQKRASAEIADEIATERPMRRLLQGDVGSGKTVVALLASAIVAASGPQVAFMAPTELLARQHVRRARDLLDPIDLEVGFLVGSIGAEERRQVLDGLASGEVDVVVGTHALFQSEVGFDELGLAVVDEQHKFGVDQRSALLEKGEDPHLLAMTATPIPRSLAHSAFGDLDLTVIREKPPGRGRIGTFLRGRHSAGDVYSYVADRVAGSDEQAFFVYPRVEPSEEAGPHRSVVAAAERLANGPLGEVRVGVLHGQMADDVQHRTMSQFEEGDIDVLCATTVVEVGVDVPSATAMVIESPDAFGLSQLHQLRGRIGRSGIDSICVLLASRRLDEETRERLRTFARTNDGFTLAEKDLELRGPGEFLGDEQSGRAEFRFGDLLDDVDWLERARADAREMVFGDASISAPGSNDFE